MQKRIGVICGAALLMNVFGVAAAQDLIEPAAPTPSLWDRVKAGARQGVAQSQLGQGGRSGTRSLSNQIVDRQYRGAMFEPITPVSGGRFQGLFARDDHTQAQLGRLEWPRAALTFVEYGASLPCWTVRARIWSSTKVHQDETFKVCASAIAQADDAGRMTTLNESSVLYLNSRMRGVRTMAIANTSSQRTEGPNPPLEPWNIRIGRDNSGRPDLGKQMAAILPRVAWVSGYANDTDIYRGSRTIATGFQDPRMWVVGFAPEGNVDARDGATTGDQL